MGEVNLRDLLRVAVTEKASDLLVTVGAPAVLRIQGELVSTNTPVFAHEETLSLIRSVLTSEQVETLERDRELDFAVELDGVGRFRGNAFFQRGSMGAAFRLIGREIPSIETLGLPPVLQDYALMPQGLFLVTGPTGHGKSTTQAAMIDIINTQTRKHIVTIEDPIEYLHENKKSIIEQREVGSDTHSFADALRHVLRQDPDVVLIGELRDLETIRTALTAAETGHLVIATLHTNDCVQSIDRLVDVFPPHQQSQIRSQLSLTLQAILAQRLVRGVTGDLVLATELLVNNSAVSNLIREGKVHQIYSVMETHAREGMRLMDSSMRDLYRNGEISFEEARKRMRHPDSLTRDF